MYNEISEFKGKTLINIEVGHCTIYFEFDDGSIYTMYHDQDCCESVTVDDIDGDLRDLIGSPLLVAEERTNRDTPPTDGRYYDSFTWTFYTLATVKATVVIKWFGTSNGYYSERVSIRKCGDC